MRGFPQKVLAGLVLAILAAGCSTPSVAPSRPSVPSNSGVYRVGQPYQVGGNWYYPREQPDYDETGIASWYGPGFYGNLTADGELFTSKDLTAAHKTLPMPVNVRVTNLENGQSLVVRVNDRGPFAAGRIIDLSERAAKLLGFYEKGTAKVRVQYVARADLPTGQPQPFGAGTPNEVQSAIPKVDTGKVETNALPEIPGTREAAVKPLRDLPKPSASATIGTADAGALPNGQVTKMPVPPVTRLYIQMGAFGNYANASRLAARLGPEVKISAIQRNGQTLYRVRSGPYPTTDDADSALSRYMGLGAADAHIIVDQ
jgi:rare lipoprotein A